MNTARSILLCSVATCLLSACSTYNPPPPAPIVTSETTVVHEELFGVVESIQLVQVTPPPVSSNGIPVSPTHSTYQIGVRLNQGGYQVFTQDNGSDLYVGQQVRIDHGLVHRV